MFKFNGSKRLIIGQLFLTVLITTFAITGFAQFTGEGAGTADDPYQVANATHLGEVRNFLGNPNVYFEQTVNIRLEGAWTPIGTADNDNDAFRGSYDGAGFIIADLTTNRAFFQGLFAYARGATLKDIHIRDMELVTSHQSGGLAAVARDTRIEYCSVTGIVDHSTNFYFGGLVGNALGTTSVHRCWADVEMYGTGRIYIGNLIGQFSATGMVSESFALGTSTTTNTNANLMAGGLIGRLTNGSVVDSYSMVDITLPQNNSQAGGLVGVGTRPIINSYSTGKVISTGGDIGGLIGNNTGAISNSYWNLEMSGLAESAGGEGRTVTQMIDSETYDNWDFVDTWSIDEGSLPYLAWFGEEAAEYNYPPLTLPPTNLRADTTPNSVNLAWNAPEMLEADGYKVYRDNVVISGPNPIEETTFQDFNVEGWTPYNYTVTAFYTVDEEEVESAPSGILFVLIMDYAEGDGSPGNPYTVATPAQLRGINYLLRHNFIQTANIDISEEEWTPLGDSNNRFEGIYDGNGYVISGLTIETNQSYQGLFSYTRGPTLNSITLEDVDIQGGSYIGALVGRADSPTTINNCYSSGEIRGVSYVGGLTGYYGGTMRFGSSSANITGTGDHVGGIIGDSWGTLHNCIATGNVAGRNLVGGLAGYDTNGSVNQSFATGRVTGQQQVGGLLGRLRTSSVNDSYALGDVVGNSNVGGFIGTNTSRAYRSFSTGRVTGEGANVGGFMGVLEGNTTVQNCYWDVQTSGQEESAAGEGRNTAQMMQQATFAGFNFTTIWSIMENDTYPYLQWERAVTNLAATVGDREVNLSWQPPLAGVPDGYRVYRNEALISGQEPINQNHFRDDDEELENYTTYTYGVAAVFGGVEFAAATIQATPLDLEGEGTEESPFLIATAQHLNSVRFVLTAHFRQTANIDLEEINWSPIGQGTGVNSFQGVYDGDGFEIRNLRAEGVATTFRRGLFMYGGAGSVFKNVNLVDVGYTVGYRGGPLVAETAGSTIINCSATGALTATGNFAFGGLVGYASGPTSIHQSWADVNISGGGYRFGGLVGEYLGTGDITESYALGNITSTSGTANIQLGGLVGRMANGSIINCYAMGEVTSTNDNTRVGGLIGENTRPVQNSFSTGMVNSTGNDVGGLIGLNTGAITSSYWNLETSGQAESAGGQGLSTGEMLDSESFAGWDFEEVWNQDDNSYPYFAWEGDEAGEHSIPAAYLPPSNLQTEIGEDRDVIHLTWEAPSIIDPIGYHVYRDEERINDQMVEELRFDDNNVQEWIWYTYSVTAVYIIDGEHEESDPSGAARILIDDFAGGDGTAGNPYLIETEVQLRAVRHILDAHYRQTADIDLSREAWTPIGSNADRFEGSYNGDDFVITEMHFDTNNSYVGLFGGARGATFSNINLVDVDIRGAQYTGALIGRGDTVTINNCSSSGLVRGTSNGVGGLIGYYNGTANDSHSSADVENTGQRTGGFVGDSWGQANRCYATGNVTGTTRVGGYAGSDYNGSHNQVFATGRVTGGNEVGGLFGFIQTATYNDTYATGDVVGNDMVGGWVGHSAFSGTVNRGYSIGRVTGETNVGGFMGFIHATNPGAVNASYWNVRTSGQEESVRGEGRDERHMATLPYSDDTYVGWNFNNVWQADQENVHDGYPFFQWHTIIPTHLDVPEVSISMINRAGVDYARIEWEAIDNANSYIIYASTDPVLQFNQWEEIDHIEGVWYEEQIDLEQNHTMFYRVIATIEDAPGDRGDRRRRDFSREIAR